MTAAGIHTRPPAVRPARLPARLHGSRLGLLLGSTLAAGLAIAQLDGLGDLPEVYRTPLSDMAVENNPEWRSTEDDEANPWREDEEKLILQPRIKAEFFPQYNYESVQNPNPGGLFQNEYELDRPVSNIFKYTF